MAQANPDPDAAFLENLAVAEEFVVEWKSCIDSLRVYVIEPSGRTFDSIAFSMINKAYKLGLACIALLKDGHPDEAFGMARSIIECSLNLRYMTLDPAKIDSRANDFVDFVFCEKKYFLEQCRKYFGPGKDLDDVESFAKREGVEKHWAYIVPNRIQARNLPLNDWKLIESADWNGWKIATEPHPLDDQINKGGWIKKQFAADFRGGSAMVHCSIRSLDNAFVTFGVPYKVGNDLKTTFDHRFEPLIIIVTNLYLAARYAFFGANVDGSESLDKLFEGAVSKLSYVRQS
jgi:uncharacterized protein DUF5677